MTSEKFSLYPQFETVGDRTIVCLDSSLQPALDLLRKMNSAEIIAKADEIRHPERQREWILSRMLMREIAGYIPDKGEHGELIWRDEHAGSLTHKKGHVALAWRAVASKSDDPGIDLESVRDLEDDLQLKVATFAEVDVGSQIGRGWSTAVFSAKEAIFKCLFRTVGYRFYYEAAELLDVNYAGGHGIMMFSMTRHLSERVPQHSKVRVDFKKIRLGADEFWLTSARRGVL